MPCRCTPWAAEEFFLFRAAIGNDALIPDLADDGIFTIRLKEPFPLLIDGIAKVSSLAPFIMPERLAKTDPFQQVTETIGSGPFRFVGRPSHRAAL